MKIQIIIPDSAIDEVEEYCQRVLKMSLQQKMQLEIDRIIDNIPPLNEARIKEAMRLLKETSEAINAD